VYTRQGHLAEAHAQLALPVKDRTINGRENNRLVASRAMAEAELAMAEKRWTDAVEACSTAIQVFKGSNHKLWWARQLIDLGDAYLGRKESGDIELAWETYQHSLDMFTEMGAPGYIQVLEQRLADLPHIKIPSSSNPGNG
jgi:hypothetical protein